MNQNVKKNINKPMFGPVVLVIALDIFIDVAFDIFIDVASSFH